MFGYDRIFVRPAHDALADRERVNAELAERGVLQLAIGRVVFDPLHVAAELIALVQHRRVPVGEPRAFVEPAAGQFTQPIEMRFDVTEQRLRQMNAQQIGQRRIGAVEIHACCVGGQQAGLPGRDMVLLRCGRLSHDRPLGFLALRTFYAAFSACRLG